MNSAKILISLPNELKVRFQAVVPSRQRSEILRKLIEQETATREQKLYECAKAVEADKDLNQEMQQWQTTLNDGLDDESW